MKTFNEWLQEQEIFGINHMQLESYFNLELDLDESDFFAGATKITRYNYLQSYKDLLNMAVKNTLEDTDEVAEKLAEVLKNINKFKEKDQKNIKIITARIDRMSSEKGGDFLKILKSHLEKGAENLPKNPPIRPKQRDGGDVWK